MESNSLIELSLVDSKSWSQSNRLKPFGLFIEKFSFSLKVTEFKVWSNLSSEAFDFLAMNFTGSMQLTQWHRVIHFDSLKAICFDYFKTLDRFFAHAKTQFSTQPSPHSAPYPKPIDMLSDLFCRQSYSGFS